MPDAHGPFRCPRSLEEHSRRPLLHFDADTVEDVDRGPVPRVPFAIAAVISPHEAGARLIIRLEIFDLSPYPANVATAG